MHKLFITFIVSLIIIVSIFPSKLFAESQDKIKIRWFARMTQEEKDSLNSHIFQFVNDYNQSQEQIEIELDITTAACTFDAADTLLKRIADGNPPDISFVRFYELWDHYLDLTPYLTEQFLSAMDTTMFHAFRTNNRLVYLPAYFSSRVFYYNKAMFDTAGLAYPPQQYGEPYDDGEPWDIDKMEEIAKLLTLDQHGHNANHPEFDAENITQYGFHWGWLNGIGMVQMFGPVQIIRDNGSVIIPSHSRMGYQWTHYAIWNEHFAPDMSVFTGDMNSAPILSEKCAMMISYTSNARDLKDSSVDWDVAAIPAYNGVHHVSWGPGGYAILKTCQYPAEAMDVIEAVLNTPDFYGYDFLLATKQDMQENIIDIWAQYCPNINHQVILDGYNYRSAYCDGEAVQFRIAAWDILNDYRSYLWEESNAQVNDALDYWFIPEIKKTLNTTTAVINIKPNKRPEQFQLYQNYPNPFNPDTKITYRLDKSDHVILKVYNLTGQEVDILVNDFETAGTHSVTWKPKGLACGIFFYRLQAGEFSETKKLILQK